MSVMLERAAKFAGKEIVVDETTTESILSKYFSTAL
jgi:hypothetical protein